MTADDHLIYNFYLIRMSSTGALDTYNPAEDPISSFLLDDDDDNTDDTDSEVDETYDENRVEDEDWEIAERGNNVLDCPTFQRDDNYLDFTKQYNRFRQHVAVRTGNAQATASSLRQGVSVAPLPVINQPKRSEASTRIASGLGVRGDRTADQLAALSKYNSRLARIDVPYVIGVGVNRKGPSAHANMKDKSDRATSEQVLDPRTRLILFKMIGRGLIHEVNGCISTGKEVFPIPCSLAFFLKIFNRRMSTMPSLRKENTLPLRFTKPLFSYSKTGTNTSQANIASGAATAAIPERWCDYGLKKR